MNSFGFAALAALAPALLLSATAQTPRARNAVPTLQLNGAVVTQFEDGPPVSSGAKLIPGETVFFRFDIVNFMTTETGKVQITGHIRVLDSRGTPIVPTEDAAIATTLSQEDKNWKPRLRSQFQIPGIAPPGTYRIRYEATDEQTHQKANGETTFEVAGPDIPAGPSLAISGMTFYRGQDDEAPLKIAAYRPGDMVWVRFNVSGYKYGEQNSIDVAYDVAVTAADGKQLFAQQDAAVEKSQAFYPQPWIPGAFSLTLQPDMHTGMYSISVTARDAVGKQMASGKADFRLE